MKTVDIEPFKAVRLETDSELDQVSAHPDNERWAASGLDIALYNVERIKKSLIRAAQMLREEDKSEASHFFVHCVDGLERFLETVILARCALKLDFNRIEVDGLSLSQIETEFTGILSAILEFQEKQDYIGMADKVEYELLTNLCSWGHALRQLQLSRQSNA